MVINGKHGRLLAVPRGRREQQHRGVGPPSSFADLDCDGYPELIDADSYWEDRPEHGLQATPRIVYKFRDGAYHLDAELMRRPPLAEAELSESVADLKWGEDPFDLYNSTLELIYSRRA